MDPILIVGNTAENSFVEDISHHLQQHEDYSDIISLKSFLNKEFCPRFIVNENDWDNIGNKLRGRKVLIISTTRGELSRDEMAMRNCLIARGAKDNGAERVILLEPDLYYSAQDRGPRVEHGLAGGNRDAADFKKFDGQPFSARLYADILKMAGVDEVMTIHNHSDGVQQLFMERFSGNFHNMIPTPVYAEYIESSDIVNHRNMVLCAPDAGARPFADAMRQKIESRTGVKIPLITMCKQRYGERDVYIEVADDSEIGLSELRDRDIVVVDDMVRTGRTIAECCKVLKLADPGKVVFFVTHFNSSREGRVNMNEHSIDEIVTSSTIPQILNRDEQGRLRHKMVVLRVERWIADNVRRRFYPDAPPLKAPLYSEDMSSKNPRWKGTMGPLFGGL